MKKAILIISAMIFSVFFTEISVYAQSDLIKLDGDFSDWKGLPFSNDPTNDAPVTEDIKTVKYYRDDNNLYLYVSRTNSYNNPWYSWYFQVVFRNAPFGNKYFHIIYSGNNYDVFYAPVISVNVRQRWYIDRPAYGVTLLGDTGEISTTFSASSDLKEAEFSIPLGILGISKSDKVTCYIKSNIGAPLDQIEWAPNKKPIIIDYGPALWSGTFVVFFIFVYLFTFKVFNNH